MIILHISDLHLNKKTEKDSVSYIINPLIESIRNFCEKIGKIDLVIFSGDLIDKGGISYDNDTAQAFLTFYEVVVNRILEATSLPESNFLIVPGNHDINRTLDSSVVEKGMLMHFTNENIVNEFINEFNEKKSYEGINRIRQYKEFEQFLYSNYSNKLLTPFVSSFILSIGNKSVGISCLNSSWRCYDSEKDKGHLLIGEYQINQSLEFIKDCDIKIAVSHHALDYLAEFDKNVVDARMQSLYDLHFTGHVHKPDAEYRIHSYGKLYKSIASGTLSNEIRTSSKEYQNGFSIINFDTEDKNITNYFFRYDHLKNSFVPNNSLGDDLGVFRINMLSDIELAVTHEKKSVISNINNDSLIKINSHLITYQTDTKAPKTIDELFVMPTIESTINIDPDKDPEYLKDLKEIINDSKNYIIFGTKESGKTILLDKILIECLKIKKLDSNIPIYIDFAEIKPDVLSAVKNFMNVNTRKATDLLEQFGVLLLVDNISFDDSEKIKLKNLNEILTKYPKSRFIGTYQQLYKDEIPTDSEYSNYFEYNKLTIRNFKTNQIRNLIKKWFKDNDKYETPKKLQTILTAFQALALPRTPFAVSLFLWIIEKQENFKPINNSTLIENFIEKLLDKHNRNEILSERFDYKNQIRLLADIAHHMYKENDNSYRISFVDLIHFVDNYLIARQFNMNTRIIVERLLSSGIFSYDFNEKEFIRFRFTCFFEFFLVKKMEVTESFKMEVLSEENYLKFINEIDYFTGLHREETDILEMVVQRMNNIYADLNEILPNNSKSIDDLFTVKESLVSKLDQKRFIKYLPNNKPTEEDLDVQEDHKLEMSNEETDIKKKEEENEYKSLAKILVLAMRILKNSEEISKEGLKQSSFESIIKNSISFAVIYKSTLQQYISMHDAFNDKELETTNNYLPLLHELFVYSNVGTLKLANIVKRKIDQDITSKTVSEFEKFLIVALYSDIRGPKYLEYLSALIKITKKNYILDMAFVKIVTYYFLRSKDSNTDNIYLNLIGDIFVKTRGYDKSRTIQIYKNKKDENNRQLKIDFE